MTPVLFGFGAGAIFGALSVALMIPLKFPDKRAAMIGAFLSRFAIGLLIPLTSLPAPAWVRGAMVGLLLSLPDAVITKAYAPIVVIGTLGGAAIGLAWGAWVAV